MSSKSRLGVEVRVSAPLGFGILTLGLDSMIFDLLFGWSADCFGNSTFQLYPCQDREANEDASIAQLIDIFARKVGVPRCFRMTTLATAKKGSEYQL